MPEIVGKPIDRVDGRLKVTGRATYTGERQIPNACHGILVMSTIPKGHIAAIDTSAAERVPRVVAVMTHLNAPKLNLKGPDQGKDEAGPAGKVLQLLQDDAIHYANQPVAVVVAETFEDAVYAASTVQVRYQLEPHQTDLAAHLHETHTPKKAGGGDEPADSRRGNVNAGLSNAYARLEHVYSTPFETHNPMEPHATVAVWDDPAHLTVYDATQGVFGDRKRVAMLLGLPAENVRVISLFIGGGFGSKGPTWSHVVLTAMAAKIANRPVKLALTRPQMFGSIGFRSETHQSLAAAAKQDGTLTALRHDTICQTSRFDEFVESASLSARMLYASPNNSTSHKLIRSDIGTPSYMRAPGEAPGTYALECAMDELAYELKMDPVAFRLKNYAEEDPEKKKPWSSKSLRQCYEQGAQRFGWSKRSLEPRSMRDGNKLVGWGMATAVYPTRRSAASAMAKLRGDGTLLVEAGTQELGTGTYTIMTQVAADALGLPAGRVQFRLGDTDYPQTPVSGGSQTAASTGSAVHAAVQALREKVVQIALTDSQSPLSGASAGDVIFDSGRISLRSNPSRGETLQKLLSRQANRELQAEASAKPGSEQEQYSMYAFGAQFAEVKVDPDLGVVEVSRMLGVFAAGRILNAKTARSQLTGGMIWGMSMALHEHTFMDDRLGRFVNNNLAEYHVPVHADSPAQIEALCVEEVDPHVNPIGAKGIGEIGITGSSAAVANAVFHATGRRVRDLPITVDKLI